LWALSALVLIPPLSRRLEPAAELLGRYIEHLMLARVAAAGLAAVVVFLLGDQVRFVGDFLLRQGSAEQTVSPQSIYSQALQLDVALHYTLPSWALQTLDLDPNLTNRILGAAYAAVLALLAVAFGRRLGASGAALIAVSSVIWFGGWVLLFTGFAKAFVEMSWLLVAAAVLGMDVLRGRRSFLWFALLIAVALLLHRSALGLLPAVCYLVLTIVMSSGAAASPARAKRTRSARQKSRPAATAPSRQISVAAGILVVLITIAFITPRVVASFQELDAAHFSLGKSGTLTALVSPLRLLDDLNLALFLVPLAPLALIIVGLSSGKQVLTPRESWFLLSLVVPYLALAVLLQPAQGVFRDFDTMAMSGVSLALVVAVVVASVLQRESAWSWLAVAVAVGAAVPTLQQLVLASDLERGLERIEAWVEGPPMREEAVRAKTWDYLGVRTYRAQQYPLATSYFARAVELAPSPRYLLEWATAAEAARDGESARMAFEGLLERAPERSTYRLTALVGLASYWERKGDTQEFAAYARGAIEMAPDHPIARQLASKLEEIGSREPQSDSP
jgi:hypothetical protein